MCTVSRSLRTVGSECKKLDNSNATIIRLCFHGDNGILWGMLGEPPNAS